MWPSTTSVRQVIFSKSRKPKDKRARVISRVVDVDISRSQAETLERQEPIDELWSFDSGPHQHIVSDEDVRMRRDGSQGFDLYNDLNYEPQMPGAFPQVESTGSSQSRSKQSKLLPFREAFLDGLLAADAPNPGVLRGKCDNCAALYSSTPALRCSTLGCNCDLTLCQTCILEKHFDSPLHRIEKWNGKFWEKTSLYALGHVLHFCQNGNYMGANPRCALPKSTEILRVLHVNGFHKMKVKFCGCATTAYDLRWYKQLMDRHYFPATPETPSTVFSYELLDLFLELSSHGGVTAHHFYLTMKNLTDNAGLNDTWTKRYEELGTAARYYRHLMMLKRAGRGHYPDGIALTEHGQCAIECAACPHPGRNLPDGWELFSPREQYLFALYIGLDADFRLKRRHRDNEREDEELGPGWAYFAEPRGLKAALDFAKANPLPPERSTCDSTHAAIERANTARKDGCSTSGVAGVVCTRHGMIRPQGLTDLQVSERYVNMDFVFLSSLKFILVLLVAISYDIACQWSINLYKRMPRFPNSLTNGVRRARLMFGVPKFHLPAHGAKCQTNFSLNYQAGWARVDGEGIERVWSFLNGFATATREMGAGLRHDFLDFQVGALNYRKLVNLGVFLKEKLELAIGEEKKTHEALLDLQYSLSPEQRKDWDLMIERWQMDHSVQPDPYQEVFDASHKPLTAVRAELLDIELKEQHRNNATQASLEAPDETMTPSMFISTGLELEEIQREIKSKLKRKKKKKKTSDSDLVSLKQKQATLQRLILKWCPTQDRYMPGITAYRIQKMNAERERRARNVDNSGSDADTLVEEADDVSDEDRLEYDIGFDDLHLEDSTSQGPLGLGTSPEDFELLLPSALAPEFAITCSRDLIEKEKRLRLAVLEGEIQEIRRLLRIKSGVFQNKKSNVVGQKGCTRANKTLRSFEKQIVSHTERYQLVWAAMKRLDPNGQDSWMTRYKELKADDVRPYNQDQNTQPVAVSSDEEDEHHPSGTDGPPLKRRRGEGYRELSWIWTIPSEDPEDTGKKTLGNALRVEYGKSHARAGRWKEEKKLVIEEIRRVPWFLNHQATEWESRSHLRFPVDDEGRPKTKVKLGCAAYAAKQAHFYRSLSTKFMTLWRPVLELNKLTVAWPE